MKRLLVGIALENDAFFDEETGRLAAGDEVGRILKKIGSDLEALGVSELDFATGDSEVTIKDINGSSVGLLKYLN